MNLPNAECIPAAIKILENSDSLFKGAKALAEANLFGHATSTLILSMEESMKAVILFFDGNGFEFRKRVKGINNLFVNHKLRYPLALLLSGMNIFQDDLEEFVLSIKKEPGVIKEFNKNKNDKKWENLLNVYALKKMNQLIEEIKWFLNAEYLRQDGIYVDYDGTIKTPLDIPKEEFDKVYIRVARMRVFLVGFLNSLDQYNKDFDEELLKAFHDNKKRLIKEKVYSNIGDLISKYATRGSKPLEVLLYKVVDFQAEVLGFLEEE